jgi:hydroxybutyrate-dimer hydrolase
MIPFPAAITVAIIASAIGTGASAASPPPFVRGPITETVYNGITDDVLTAGLGKTGLMGAAPAFVDPASPTPAELRRNAIYTNYRALVDYTALGGMGVLYGPNIDANGQDTLGEGRIAGRETIAWSDDGSGSENVTLMVQVPDTFNPAKPCIVTATSSGSRGIYGAIATSGEWGLKRGCAVAYADKGTGNGLHDLMTGTVIARDGTRLNAATAGTEAIFKADVSADALATFNAATPDRVAYKHAHSQQNPEKDWGRHTLQAVKFAFYVLKQRFGAQAITPASTIVIASSVSNGAGAALAAAELDKDGLIDGVAVSEPNVAPKPTHGLSVVQGETVVERIGSPLAGYFTFANVFQPCALLSARAGLSLNVLFWPEAYTLSAQNRCAALAARGLVQGATLAEQADSALDRMRRHGWGAESDFLQQSMFRFATNAIAVTYVNSLGRFSVLDNVCGYSFAATDLFGNVAPQLALTQAAIFATGNGIPPTSGVSVVYNPSVGGAKLDFLAVSPTSGGADFALDGALCLRSLVTGRDPVTKQPLAGERKAQSDRVRAGIVAVTRSARLQGKPAIIVAGRNDALLPVNQTSRAYFGRNQIVDGAAAANVRYVEVTNAQHFDSFIALGVLLGYDTRYIPLHVYFNRALDAMYAHLSESRALPPSQVVRTTPRASSLMPIAPVNVPPIADTPLPEDMIVMSGRTLRIPD